jgi:D-alanyl-D-alanine carboxypeptidase
MKRYFTLLLLSFMLALHGGSVASKPRPAQARQEPARGGDKQVERILRGVQALMDKLRAAAGFPGATVGFVLPGGRAASVSTGLSDVESARPLAPDDMMLAGSVGKTFVAALTLQLAQEGRLELDGKVERWLGGEPWFRRLPNAGEITLRTLLNHTSGIPNHVEDERFFKALVANPDPPCKPEELIAYVLDRKPLFHVGKGYSYADTNYILVGMIVEKVSGRPLYDEVTRRFLKPFKLVHTVPQEGRVMPGVVNGYTSLAEVAGPQSRIIVGGKFTFNPQCEWAGGGFASTAEDLARWAAALYGGEVLKKPYLAQMLETVGTDEGGRYGLGVDIGGGKWGTVYGHDGLFPGYVSAMEYFPRYRVAVAIQFNTDFPDRIKKDPGEYIDDIMQIITGELPARQSRRPRGRD